MQVDEPRTGQHPKNRRDECQNEEQEESHEEQVRVVAEKPAPLSSPMRWGMHDRHYSESRAARQACFSSGRVSARVRAQRRCSFPSRPFFPLLHRTCSWPMNLGAPASRRRVDVSRGERHASGTLALPGSSWERRPSEGEHEIIFGSQCKEPAGPEAGAPGALLFRQQFPDLGFETVASVHLPKVALLVHKPQGRNAVDTVLLAELVSPAFAVEELRPRNLLLGHELVQLFLVVVEADADDLESLGVKFFVSLLHVWELGHTRPAPRRPKIY